MDIPKVKTKTPEEWYDVLRQTPGGKERLWLIRAIQEDAINATVEAVGKMAEQAIEEASLEDINSPIIRKLLARRPHKRN